MILEYIWLDLCRLDIELHNHIIIIIIIIIIIMTLSGKGCDIVMDDNKISLFLYMSTLLYTLLSMHICAFDNVLFNSYTMV